MLLTVGKNIKTLLHTISLALLSKHFFISPQTRTQRLLLFFNLQFELMRCLNIQAFNYPRPDLLKKCHSAFVQSKSTNRSIQIASIICNMLVMNSLVWSVVSYVIERRHQSNLHPLFRSHSLWNGNTKNFSDKICINPWQENYMYLRIPSSIVNESEYKSFTFL